jgi:hypothetical protein
MNKHTAVAPDSSRVFTRNSKTALYTHLTVTQEDGEWKFISWHKSERTAQQTKRQWEASPYVVGKPCKILKVEVA